MVGRALLELGVLEDVNVLLQQIEGIVLSQGKKLTARHPVYVRELFEKVVSPELIRDCIIALLSAYSDYAVPIVKNVGKVDGFIFKSVLNHRFVKSMMRNDELRVMSIYEAFETRFHADGMYWLQYGLALRGFDHHAEALEKLATAREAFSSPQIEHAYAQQLLIVAQYATNWDEIEPKLNEA